MRPNINKCYADFKTLNGKILYGLGAIKNVGFEAVSNLVNERIKNGNFKSLMDFIKRVSSKDINKLQLEGLVKSGAFDELETNRKKLVESIPKIIQLNKIFNDEKISNQSSLFDGNNSSDPEDFIFEQQALKKELLNEEFKSLGFFISDHPLNEFRTLFSQMNIVSYKDFMLNAKNEGLVSGALMSIQENRLERNPVCYCWGI